MQLQGPNLVTEGHNLHYGLDNKIVTKFHSVQKVTVTMEFDK